MKQGNGGNHGNFSTLEDHGLRGFRSLSDFRVSCMTKVTLFSYANFANFVSCTYQFVCADLNFAISKKDGVTLFLSKINFGKFFAALIKFSGDINYSEFHSIKISRIF